MTTNPVLTPIDALRELTEAIYRMNISTDYGDLDMSLRQPMHDARATLDHYTRTGWDGPSVKARRIAAGLTQEQLADLTDLNITTIRRWEQGYGKPSPKTMKLLWPILAQPHERETR
jgi:DNA-binding transcriptional regulator YiaG